ncbi:MAG: alpha/beta hydrolase [Prochloraceae cyanobacterium]|nr:alpha/beta hydrolase [Prochloraceae cyanobacterium]
MLRKQLKLQDLEISYLEWAKGDKPLLLLHGMADCAAVWSSLGQYLEPSYHIVAPDLRGHGESSKPETDYTCDRAIADLEALMDSLGWDNAHVLAHSWSAKILTVWATKNPKRLRSLILVDPFFINKIPSFAKITFPLFYRILPFLKAMGPFQSKAEAEKLAKTLKQYRDWSELQQQAFFAGIEAKPNGTWGSKFTVAARNEIFTEVMQVAGLTEAIDIPTLFIQPRSGLNRTPWQLKPFKTYLKNLQICQVPGNHWVHLVNPEVFNQTVARFLAAQP